MNTAEVIIGTEQGARPAFPFSADTAVTLPLGMEVRVMVEPSQESAVSIPVTQAAALACEDSEVLLIPLFSNHNVGTDINGIKVTWLTNIATTTRARHRLYGETIWVLTTETTSHTTSHSRSLGTGYKEGERVEWCAGGDTIGGDFVWDSARTFTITGGEPIPEG